MEKLLKYRQYIWAAVGLLLVGALAWFLYRSYKNRTSEGAEETLEPNPSNISFTNNQLIDMAGRLESAMNGNGTDSQTVLNVLDQLRTSDDWYALVRAFGRRQNRYGGIFSETGNLMDWLRWEYNDYYNFLAWSDRAKINEILNRLGQSSL